MLTARVPALLSFLLVTLRPEVWLDNGFHGLCPAVHWNSVLWQNAFIHSRHLWSAGPLLVLGNATWPGGAPRGEPGLVDERRGDRGSLYRGARAVRTVSSMYPTGAWEPSAIRGLGAPKARRLWGSRGMRLSRGAWGRASFMWGREGTARNGRASWSRW